MHDVSNLFTPTSWRCMTTTLSASRELDALVAEKVFGLPTRQWNGDLAVMREDETYPHPLPAYSTSIEAAWQVVEHFNSFDLDKNPHRNAHFGVPAGNRLWSCSLTRYKPECFGEGEGETAPLAICRAALAAVGHDS